MLRLIITSYIMYIVTLGISALFLEFGVYVLNTNHNLIIELFKLDNYQLIVLYPRYHYVVHFFLFVLEHSAVFLFFSGCYFFSVEYRKSGSREQLLKVFILYTFIFSLDRTLVLIHYKNFLGLHYNGKVFDSRIKQCQQTEADEYGINRYIKNNNCMAPGYNINIQGFRSNHDFSKKYIDSLRKNTKVIMFIGDSHTEGCCASPVSNSFVDIIDRKSNMLGLNFGVGGTDPLQYRLVAEHYIPEIKPDIRVVVVCVSNDYMNFDRIPAPNRAMFYQTDFTWFDAYLPWSHPDYQPNKMFKNWTEAKEHYLENYFMFGSHISMTEKIFISPFNINSILYYGLKKFLSYSGLIKNMTESKVIVNHIKKDPSISLKHLLKIDFVSKQNGAKLIFAAIPDMVDIEYKSEMLETKYKKDFYPLKINYPSGFKLSDYISEENNQFNNFGHKKYADFLIMQIQKSE